MIEICADALLKIFLIMGILLGWMFYDAIVHLYDAIVHLEYYFQERNREKKIGKRR